MFERNTVERIRGPNELEDELPHLSISCLAGICHRHRYAGYFQTPV